MIVILFFKYCSDCYKAFTSVLQDPFDSQSSFCEPATRLCLCQVEKSVVTVVLPSDSSVQIHGILNGCVVEDVRKGTISAFPRLALSNDLFPHF